MKPDVGRSAHLLAESVLMGTVTNRIVKEEMKEEVIWNAKMVQFLDKPEASKGLGRALPSDRPASI